MEGRADVVVLGTIHGQHLSSPDYSLSELRAIIEAIEPDLILAEIPRDSFLIANEQLQKSGRITEPRVLQYPELSEVVFPLSKQMGIPVRPVSAWTEGMADARDEKLESIKFDRSRARDWEAYQAARARSAALFDEMVSRFSPAVIHTDEFDAILDVELSVFSALFNDDLGQGGWENINNAHYALIDAELNLIAGAGKRVLIVFGAGHKGWLKRKLSTRSDIKLTGLLDAL